MESYVYVLLLSVSFISLGAILPIVEDSFNEPASSYDVNGINENFNNAKNETDPTSWLDIIWSVITMFFWSTGNSIPVIIELIVLLPLRITFFYLLLKDVIVHIIPFT